VRSVEARGRYLLQHPVHDSCLQGMQLFKKKKKKEEYRKKDLVGGILA